MPAPTTHARQQIREALATAVTGLTTTSTRVFQSRMHALAVAELPCLLVNTDDEKIEPLTVHSPALLERTLTAVVRGVARAASDLDDTLDTIAKEVETALGAATLSGLVKTITLAGIEVEMDNLIDKPVGVISLSYQISYLTTANAPTTAL